MLSSVPSQVVVLSVSLAHSLFGDQDPLGNLVQLPGGRYPERRYRVIGVAGDVRFLPRQMQEGFAPMLYEPIGGDGTVPPSTTCTNSSRR